MQLLHLPRLALLWRVILLNQQIGLLLIGLNGSNSLAIDVHSHGCQSSSSRSLHSASLPARGRVKPEHLARAMRAEQAALRDLYRTDRRLINWQRTTTLQHFKDTGSPDDDIQPRIDRYSSVEWLANQSSFNPSLRTVFVLHGYMSLSLAQQRWANDMRNEIYRRKNAANMFFVDWNHKSNILWPIYLGALNGAMEVANDLKQIIDRLKLAFPQWDTSNIQLAGHSLGAHVAGRLGYLMGGKVKLISAMDPPDTLQDDWPASTKLTSDDAQFVIAYVTDGNGLGSRYKQADVNLLVNGGFEQPGCVYYLGFMCRHMLSAFYNTYSMGKCIIVGYRADSYEQFLRGEVGFCEENSDACVGAGNWWQYDEGLDMSEKHFRPGPNWVARRQSAADNSKYTPYDREYFVKLGQEKPYCIFTYQVVVGFENTIHEQQLKRIDRLYISLDVSSNGTAGNDIRTELSKYSRFRSLGRRRASFGPGIFEEAISGRHDRDGNPPRAVVYTGLALIEPHHRMYNLMPMKFVRATVWLPSQTAGSSAEPHERPYVQVNFMSENRYERRQLYSGRVDEVHWFPPSRG